MSSLKLRLFNFWIEIQIIVLNKTEETIDFEINVIDTGIGIAKENYDSTGFETKI